MMDDKFLYQLREQPHPEFVATLHHKLKLSQPALPRWKPAFSFGVIGLLLVVTLFSATPVRSAFLSFLTRVGGLPFEVTIDYPGDDSGKVTIIEAQHIPLGQALAIFPSPVYLPQNVTLEQEVSLYDFGQGNFYITMMGQTSQGVQFSLNILTNPDPNGSESIYPNAVEEISLDADHPAALIRGGWNYDTKAWDDTYGTVRIKWTLDNLLYDLGGNADNLETLLEVARTTLP